MLIEAACGCNVGKLRRNNEDNFLFCGRILPQTNNGTPQVLAQKLPVNDPQLFAVFDGMGGEEAGEAAAFAAALAASRAPLQQANAAPCVFLQRLCDEMNRAVCTESQKLLFGRMGSTAAMLLFSKNTVYTCNLGDSRVYSFSKGRLLRLSEDHVEPLPPNSRRKAGLMQYLGIPEEDLRLEPHLTAHTACSQDMYLLCSDGLTDMLTEQEIGAVLAAHKSVRQAAAKLIEKALQNGGKDNVTVLLCSIK